MIRLFNENGCETPTATNWDKVVRDAIRPLVKEAVEAGISLRDLQTLIFEETATYCAEERLRRAMKERIAKKPLANGPIGKGEGLYDFLLPPKNYE